MAGELPVAIGVVVGQDGDRVLVSVPVSGFPPGFSLRQGDKVALAADASQIVAKPFIKTRVVSGTDASALAMPATTAQSAVPASDRVPVGSRVIFETESSSGQGQTIAVRTAQ